VQSRQGERGRRETPPLGDTKKRKTTMLKKGEKRASERGEKKDILIKPGKIADCTKGGNINLFQTIPRINFTEVRGKPMEWGPGRGKVENSPQTPGAAKSAREREGGPCGDPSRKRIL